MSEDQHQEDMDLEPEEEGAGEGEPKEDKVEIQLSPAQRFNRYQEAAQAFLELEENAKKRLALNRADKKLKEKHRRLVTEARTGIALVSKDEAQTALDLGGSDGTAVAAGLSAMADRAAADFSAGSGFVETPAEAHA